ncbi:MAG: hypothetical protein CMH35_00725 [Microbacterium sp.]|nr:hypothetical protein [Planctomycetota bacterium]MAM53373.1 hypothetical protein [Microbacterium sp.]
MASWPPRTTHPASSADACAADRHPTAGRRGTSTPDRATKIREVHRIIGLRNVLAHGYAVVDDNVVWAAGSLRVPELRIVVDALLAGRT